MIQNIFFVQNIKKMPRTKTQRGGEPVAEVAPPAADPVEPRFESYEDTLALSGGAKKKAAAKKPAAKKPAAKKPAAKKGGALVDDVKNLAVPFAILLAKQGLEGMFKKKEKKASAAVSVRRRSAAGGSCSSCATVPAQAGGAKVNRYKQLSDEIDRFLAKY